MGFEQVSKGLPPCENPLGWFRVIPKQKSSEKGEDLCHLLFSKECIRTGISRQMGFELGQEFRCSVMVRSQLPVMGFMPAEISEMAASISSSMVLWASDCGKLMRDNLRFSPVVS